MTNGKILAFGGIFTLAFAAFLFWPQNEDTTQPSTTLADVDDEKIEVVMYKRETCMCCAKWADHMETAEFKVEQVVPEDLFAVKDEAGVPQELASCHTAKVGGYIVEGHVPLEDVRRLLDEKPDAIGITVPGMPIGSPGMEVEGRPADKYDVLLIHNDGTTSVWASH